MGEEGGKGSEVSGVLLAGCGQIVMAIASPGNGSKPAMMEGLLSYPVTTTHLSNATRVAFVMSRLRIEPEVVTAIIRSACRVSQSSLPRAPMLSCHTKSSPTVRRFPA